MLKRSCYLTSHLKKTIFPEEIVLIRHKCSLFNRLKVANQPTPSLTQHWETTDSGPDSADTAAPTPLPHFWPGKTLFTGSNQAKK